MQTDQHVGERTHATRRNRQRVRLFSLPSIRFAVFRILFCVYGCVTMSLESPLLLFYLRELL